MRRRPAVLLAVLLMSATVGSAAPPLVLPGGSAPPAVAALGALDRAQAFGVSADGTLAAAAFPSERGGPRSVVRVARAGGDPASIELTGEAVAMAVTASGDTVFGIVRDVDRKGAVRGVGLVCIDTRALKLAPSVDLPVTSRGLALQAGDASLLVAARDEIRTFSVPDLASGPLYRVPGDNRAVAPLSGSTRLLVGQGASVILVDLAATQGREGLPVIATAQASAPVRVLASSPDEPTAVALLENGEAVTIATDPLSISPRGPATALAWPGEKEFAAAPAVVAAAVPETEVAAPPPPATDPTPATGPPPEEMPAPVAAPPPPPEVTVQEAPAAPSPPAADPGSGRVTGAARAEAREIVFLGPNNILKEAGRVPVAGDGTFMAPALAAGSYRVIVAGARGRVLVCRPAFLTLQVGEGGAGAIPEIEVVRSY